MGDDESAAATDPDPTPVGEPLLVPPGGDDPSVAGPSADRARRRSRGIGLLSVIALAVVGVVGTLVVLSGGDDEPPLDAIALDAWVPYWTLDDAVPDAPDRLRSVREVSPFWYDATAVDRIEASPYVDAAAAEALVEAARDAGAEVVPSIVDATEPGEMAAILGDPERRRAHVEAITSFAREAGADGIDLDYERFAFSDDRSTWSDTRPSWVAFVEELAAELHADGRTLTVSIPPIYDGERSATSGYWVYDHGAIAPHVDRIRLMAYDYSVGEPGPIAPLEFVQRSIDGALEVGVDPSKLVLGLPIYGRNWPIEVVGTCPDGAELEEQTSVTARTVDELVERRGATPVFDEVTGESSFDYEVEFDDGRTGCVQRRRVHYVDARGALARLDLARSARLGGVSLWAYGFDDAEVWDRLLPHVAR